MSQNTFEIRSFKPHRQSPYTRATLGLYNSNSNVARYDWETFLCDTWGSSGYIALTPDGEPIGAAVVREWDVASKELSLDPDLTAYLCVVAVASHLKRKRPGTGHGIGSALMEYVHGTAEEWGKTGILLASSEQAVGFYESHGYELLDQPAAPRYMYRSLEAPEGRTAVDLEAASSSVV